MIKVGLIGLGLMGRTHANAYKNVPEAKVAAVFDLDPGKRREFAALLGARDAADLDEVLGDPEIDAVDVCVPTTVHREVVVRAAQAGKHVFCEKPIALDTEEAVDMVSACRSAGVKLMIGHVLRFFPDYIAAREVALSGKIGSPKIVRSIRAGSMPTWGWQNWYADPNKSGGPAVDLIIHDFDWLRWTFGPVERVFAKGLTYSGLGFDVCFATLRFQNGMMAHVEGSWAEPKGAPFTTSIEIAGTKGLYTQSNLGSMPLRVRTREEGSKLPTDVPESPLAEDPYTRELRAFYQAIGEGREVPVTGEEAVEALRISLAALESIKTGRKAVISNG